MGSMAEREVSLENIPINSVISLTDIRRSDEATYVEHLREKDIYDHTLRIPYPYTLVDAAQWLTTVEERVRRAGRLEWALRLADGKLIGAIGFLEDLVIGQSHRAEIGYWLAKPY